MSFELPSLMPPDELPLNRPDEAPPITIAQCHLLGHNVAADGKADPISFDDPFFVYVYQYGDRFFVVRGLNPEMMKGEEVPAREAQEVLGVLPYRVS